jgi:hypothetical protein
MRYLVPLTILLLALFVSGCAHEQKKNAPVFQSFPELALPVDTNAAPATSTETNVLIVTPAEGLSGKVSRVDLNLKYVVLSFPIGQMARLDQQLNLFRGGLKVGEVKVTGPQLNNSIIADIIAGEAQVGDEAIDK